VIAVTGLSIIKNHLKKVNFNKSNEALFFKRDLKVVTGLSLSKKSLKKDNFNKSTGFLDFKRRKSTIFTNYVIIVYVYDLQPELLWQKRPGVNKHTILGNKKE